MRRTIRQPQPTGSFSTGTGTGCCSADVLEKMVEGCEGVGLTGDFEMDWWVLGGIGVVGGERVDAKFREVGL